MSQSNDAFYEAHVTDQKMMEHERLLMSAVALEALMVTLSYPNDPKLAALISAVNKLEEHRTSHQEFLKTVMRPVLDAFTQQIKSDEICKEATNVH